MEQMKQAMAELDQLAQLDAENKKALDDLEKEGLWNDEERDQGGT